MPILGPYGATSLVLYASVQARVFSYVQNMRTNFFSETYGMLTDSNKIS